MKLLKFLKHLILLLAMIAMSTVAIFFIQPDVLPTDILWFFQKAQMTIFHPDHEVIDIDPNFYPYYHFLNETEQKLYQQILTQASNGTPTFIPYGKVTLDEVNETMNALFNDRSELFWLDTHYSYKYKDEICQQITINFNETFSQIETSKRIFEENTQAILKEARKLKTDEEKEKYVHDALIAMTSYDLTSSINQSAYSVLVNHSSVCAGYARAFQYLMIELEIPTYYCVGTSNGEDHAWNIVYMNGNFYNVDVTWDDSTHSYAFYNKTDEEFSKTHQRSEVSKLLPKCNSHD